MADTGILYVIAAPSGTGKTTLVKAVIDSMPKITVSISHTTRQKRPNESHGTHYFFIDDAEFKKMQAASEFLEHAKIFDHSYGTAKQAVLETLAKGIDVILEIDWQGHQQIKRLLPDCISIFILPPSLEDLRERLIKRNQDHTDIIQKRLKDAKETISHIQEFDYIVINDDFVNALHDLKIIIEAGKLQGKRQIKRFHHLIEGFAHLDEDQ